MPSPDQPKPEPPDNPSKEQVRLFLRTLLDRLADSKPPAPAYKLKPQK